MDPFIIIRADLGFQIRHKSYHPYLEKNKDRVRKDEERAAVLEADEERRMIDAVNETCDTTRSVQ